MIKQYVGGVTVQQPPAKKPCKHQDKLWIWTFWLSHAFCRDCGLWLATSLDDEINLRRPTVHERPLSALGQTKTLGQWADELGIAVVTLQGRLRTWPLEQALTQPGKCRRHIGELS